MSETEQDLFETGRARGSDPETSREAALSVNSTKLEVLVMNVLAVSPMGLTCGQLTEITGLPWNTISPRLAPLREKGLAKVMTDKEGNPVKRQWRRSRRNQMVWTVA